MPLTGNHVDAPDWVYNGDYSYLDDTIGVVRSITQIETHTDTTKTHLLLVNAKVAQFYADVSKETPLPAPTTTPAIAPSVILGVDGRTWQAVDEATDLNPYLPDIYTGAAQAVDTPADISAQTDAAIQRMHLINSGVSYWYSVDTTGTVTAAVPLPAAAPPVIQSADGRFWVRNDNSGVQVGSWMQNAEIT
ncbi:hypothetical protein [Thalassobius sp. Cn5-15]|uniref:hypothetical protein n=1 Tax=Thalassobius sp. Cn5-15 TaxID=2917763 RepID=UPI001EF2DA25|nr:hypothetical protein [Thalassobius sp. Cn5-15]MCG7492461.1 hypothetical protein [Thalassobius sp. Cn5-15]